MYIKYPSTKERGIVEDEQASNKLKLEEVKIYAPSFWINIWMHLAAELVQIINMKVVSLSLSFPTKKETHQS